MLTPVGTDCDYEVSNREELETASSALAMPGILKQNK